MWTVDGLSYSTRKKLTIDHTKVGATLTNFPVLVKLTDARFDWSHSNADGFDIRFTASDGTTLLKYERERHDGADYAEYWVKIPSVSSTTDTDFYIYYRTTDTADGADPTNVWDANYKAVYHMKDLTTSTIEDSTSQNNDLTKSAANQPIEATGKIAKGQDFDGTDDDAYRNTTPTINTNGFTVEMWVNFDTVTVEQDTVGVSSVNRFGMRIKDNNDGAVDGRLTARIAYDGGWIQGAALRANGLSAGTWYYFVLVGKSGASVLYKNGAAEATDTTSFTGVDGTGIRLGDYYSGAASPLNGKLDEVRFSSSARSAEWITASYHSEADSLLTYGAEEVSISVSDTGAGSDIMSAIRNTISARQDSGAGVDALSALLASSVLSDSGTGADILSALRAAISGIDTGSGTDIMAAIRNSFVAQDSGSGSELSSIINTFKLSDTGSGNDILSALLIALAIQDVGSGSDEMSGILAQIIASDIGVGNEALNILARIALSDSGSATDAINTLIALSVSDTGIGIEATNMLISISLADSGVGAEIVRILNNLVVSDNGSAIEAVAILAVLSIADSGLGIDTSSLIYAIIKGDSGAGSELVKRLNSFAVSDSAIGSETLRVLTGLIIQDAGVGSEETYIKNFVGLHDSGLAVEAAKIFVELAIQDNGESEEIINLIQQIQIYDSGLGVDVMNLIKKVYPYSDKNNPFNKKSSPYHNLPRE
jgi:hypothetical protein